VGGTAKGHAVQANGQAGGRGEGGSIPVGHRTCIRKAASRIEYHGHHRDAHHSAELPHGPQCCRRLPSNSGARAFNPAAVVPFVIAGASASRWPWLVLRSRRSLTDPRRVLGWTRVDCRSRTDADPDPWSFPVLFCKRASDWRHQQGRRRPGRNRSPVARGEYPRANWKSGWSGKRQSRSNPPLHGFEPARPLHHRARRDPMRVAL
jgi:hypothetical protein